MDRPYDSDFNPTEQGIFKIKEAQYRQIKAANVTYLKLFNRSPLHVWTAFNDEDAEIVKPTYAMRQGTAFHWAVLEPHRLDEDVAIDPGWSKNSKKYKEWAKLAEGKLIISAIDARNVRRMAENVYRKKSAMQYIKNGYAEITLLWFEPEFGMWCKGRIDWVTAEGDVLIDLKKTQIATQWAFTASIRRYEYYKQAAHYCRGYRMITGQRPKKWIWIVSEIDRPNECNTFAADMAAVDSAEVDVENWYWRYAECERTGEWVGYADEVIELGYDYDAAVNDDIPW